jgi:hypothetical protein
MATGAVSAFQLEGGEGIFARGDIIQGSSEELMSLRGSEDFIGKHPGVLVVGQPGEGIEPHGPDLVAKIAADPSRFVFCDQGGIGLVRPIDRRPWSMTGGTVSLCFRKI